MILTGKAKEGFYNWVFNNPHIQNKFGDLQDVYDFVAYLPESCQYSLMIDWFDSVGIHILPEIVRTNKDKYLFGYTIWHQEFRKYTESKTFYKSRDESINQSITKVDEIYNKREE